MKKNLLLIPFTCFLMLGDAISQFPEQLMVQQQFFSHYGKIYQKGVKGPDIVGPRFLFDEWRPMELRTKEFSVELSAVKMNLYNTTLELLYQGEEKIIFARDFEYVVIHEDERARRFVPALGFTYKGKSLEGFMEVAGEGPEQVLVHHYTGIKEPGPSANIVGGPTNNVLVKSSKTYIFSKGDLILVKNKKQFIKYFKSKSKQVEKLMKQKKTDFKDPNQLYEIVELVRG